jgi:hypothetical protein
MKYFKAQAEVLASNLTHSTKEATKTSKILISIDFIYQKKPNLQTNPS